MRPVARHREIGFSSLIDIIPIACTGKGAILARACRCRVTESDASTGNCGLNLDGALVKRAPRVPEELQPASRGTAREGAA